MIGVKIAPSPDPIVLISGGELYPEPPKLTIIPIIIPAEDTIALNCAPLPLDNVIFGCLL